MLIVFILLIFYIFINNNDLLATSDQQVKGKILDENAMCLILFAYETHPCHRLAFAANRDEFYARKTRPARFWKRAPQVLAGKDLKEGGTWMGITLSGRFAAVTNYREPGSQKSEALSRGFLVLDFLMEEYSPRKYLEKIRKKAECYNGFNLLAGDTQRLYHYSNRGEDIRKIEPGIHGLSNHLLDTPWPKVEKGKRMLAETLSKPKPLKPESLFAILEDNSKPPDDSLPDTGVSLEWERILSPLFVSSQVYGTRSSTVLLWDSDGTVQFTERTFHSTHGPEGENETVLFRFFARKRKGKNRNLL
jgi:uncharacterized protein with NRDE domain